MAHDLSLDEISERLIDAILNEQYINKENLHKIIKPILKIWLKKTDEFKSQKASKSQLQKTIENRGLQQKFWLNKFREIIGEDNMQPYYDELQEILIKEGHIKK